MEETGKFAVRAFNKENQMVYATVGDEGVNEWRDKFGYECVLDRDEVWYAYRNSRKNEYTQVTVVKIEFSRPLHGEEVGMLIREELIATGVLTYEDVELIKKA